MTRTLATLLATAVLILTPTTATAGEWQGWTGHTGWCHHHPHSHRAVCR